MSILPKSTVEEISPVKPLINVGACLDIPTGCFVKGVHGENILLGGLGPLTGITGPGNSYKSTIMHYMTLSAASRIASTSETYIETYDTEMNISLERLNHLSQAHPSFEGIDITNNGTWKITDAENHPANKWFEKMKEYLGAKKAAGDKILVPTPFLDRDKKQMKIILPTFRHVDSLSRFQTDDVSKMQDENELGDKGALTIHMKQGLSKLRFLMEAPLLAVSCCDYLTLTAHIGQEHAMAQGPYDPKPGKKIPHMKPGEKIKGVTDQFYYLTTAFFAAASCGEFKNQTTKGSEFPLYDVDNTGDVPVDLNLVGWKILRSKFGPSGVIVDVAVSQRDGVLPTLTEFLNIKDNDRFGMEGNDRNYSLTLLPDVGLSRTTIRAKINENEKLRRAMNITSELCQMRQFFRTMDPKLLEAKHVYEGVKNQGYDWDFILENTRGWWTVNNDNHPSKYFLSTKDIAEMAIGIYHPYWMEDDRKTVKKEYLKK